MADQERTDEDELDPGAYIGHEPELAAETIPGGVQPADERVAGYASRSSGIGGADHRVEGRDDEWPQGHRAAQPSDSDDDARREAGRSG